MGNLLLRCDDEVCVKIICNFFLLGNLAYCIYSFSVENGTLPNFSNVDCSIDSPHVLPDEAQEGDKIVHFILLTKIMRNQSDIIQYLHIKYHKKMTFHWDQDKQFIKLSNELRTTISLITSTTKFPQKENMCYTICFLYLASCFATILLYRRSVEQKKFCLEAALNIKSITELILECDAFEDMYCSMRGIQQIVHFLSAAITVFKDQEAAIQYESTLQLAQKLASISPATEVIGNKNSNTLKRNILHLPNETIVQDLQIPIQQPQPQQYQPMPSTTTSRPMHPQYQHQFMSQQQQQQQGYPMSLVEQQSVMNIPNQQSLLGLLLYNEDDL